jgi:hypothetical protein
VESLLPVRALDGSPEQPALIFDYMDCLAGTEAHRKLNLGAHFLRRFLDQYVAAFVIAKLENLRRNLDAPAVSFAKIVVHNDSHPIAPKR